jgi:hypothetical protein
MPQRAETGKHCAASAHEPGLCLAIFRKPTESDDYPFA